MSRTAPPSSKLPKPVAPAVAKPPASAALQLGPLAGVLGFHLAKASVTAFDLFERHIGQQHDLRKVDYSLLMLLLANGPLPPKRLALGLSVSAPKLTQLLDGLQARGLVQRQRSQLDRRSHNVVLTAAGQALARVTAEAAEPMERQLLRRLSVAEHAMLIELLQKVTAV